MLIISSATVAALVGQDCCCCVINNILIGKLMKGNVQTFLARRTLRLLRIPYLYDWCNMDNFINMLNAKVLPVANKVGTQRHMTAIRKGIISTLPLTIVGSFFTILNNMPIEAVANFWRLTLKFWTCRFVIRLESWPCTQRLESHLHLPKVIS